MFTFLLAFLLAVTVTLILPLVSLIQTFALRRRIADLEARQSALEAGRASSAPTSPTSAPTAPPPRNTAIVGAELARPEVSARLARPEPLTEPALAPPVAAPTWPPPATPLPPPSLETTIGSRWMLYAGITVLLLGLSFFLKLAIDNGWINETTRVLLGCAAGGALVAGGLSFVRRGYVGYGQILAGGGVAVVYFSVYAAFAFYGLVSQQPAFALLVLVTIGAAGLADRQMSQGLALVAIVGGFATPFLVGREGGSHIVLFTYDAILVAGTMALARRHPWPLLNLASFLLTLVAISAWYVRSYQPSLYLSFEIFLTLFCVMFLWVRSHGRHASDLTGRQVRDALFAAPILYHLASLHILDPHATALLIYLTAFTAAGVAAGVQRDSGWLRLLVWLAAWLPALGWIDDHANPEWLARIAATVVAMYAMHLFAQLKKVSDREPLQDPDYAVMHLNGLGLLAAAYVALENTRPSWIPVAGFVLAAWHGALAAGLWRRDITVAVHGVALAGALAATAVALQFDGTWVTVGWAAEGAGLFWLGRRVSRHWLRLGGGLLLTLAALRLVGPDYEAISSGFTPILNARFAAAAFTVALLYWVARVKEPVENAVPEGVSHKVQPGATSAGSRVAVVGANILTLVVLTEEIAAYWPRHEIVSSLMREALMSMTWAVYAAGLIAVGIRKDYAPIRYLAIVVFGITVIKVFTVDLANLGGIYRVLGFLVVGAVLLGASFLYQRRLRSESAAATMYNPPDER